MLVTFTPHPNNLAAVRQLARDLEIGIDKIKMVRLGEADSLPEVRLHEEPRALLE